jgi:hypothetical protein
VNSFQFLVFSFQFLVCSVLSQPLDAFEYKYTDNSANIALGKPVKVSSSAETPGWMSEYLVDGITHSTDLKRKGWSSAFGIDANWRGCNEWVEIDLDAIYRINRVAVYTINDSSVDSNFPVDFRIQVSEDEVVWADVVVETDYEKKENSVQNFTFDPINARYVRFVGTKFKAVKKYRLMQFAEIEVYHVPATNTLSGKIEMTADSSYKLYVNGTLSATGDIQMPIQPVNVTLKSGTNIIAVEANSIGEYGGLLGQITIDGKLFFTTNNMWKMSASAPEGWNTLAFDDTTWEYAKDRGPYGVFPWKYDLSGLPKNTLARWIWNPDNVKSKHYFRFTFYIDSITGAVTATYLSPETSPVPETYSKPRTAVLPVVPAPLWNLAKNGTPEFVIVKNVSADIVENFAAAELQSYLKRMIGTEPSIATDLDKTKINILLGSPASNRDVSDALKNIGVTVNENSLGYDGYIMRTTVYKGNKMILLSGYKPRAVLYAAYHLLETLGCRFLGPKTVPSNEIVPFLPNLTVDNLNDTQIPVRKLRMMSNGPYFASDTETLEKMVDWGTKNHYNSFLLTLRVKDRNGNTLFSPWEPYDPTPLTKRGFEIMMAGHNWVEFIENPTSTWYTDEANIQKFLENVKAYTLGHPEAAAIGAWQMDGPRGKIRIDRNGQTWRFTEWNLYIMNRIAEMFRANGIDKRVMWMAYVESNRPPDYIAPDPLLDLYYYHAWQNYQAPLNSETADKQVDWILNDYYRRPQNSDHAPEPIPDSLLAQRPVVENWSKYLSNKNFQGDKIVVDHLSAGIGIVLKYPAISYTILGPVYSLEDDRRYERESGFNGYTNCFSYTDFGDYLFPVSPDPYLHRRMAETLWNDLANRDILDNGFYTAYYGAKYATRVIRFFDKVYFELLADKRDYYSVKKIMGDLYATLTDLRNTMLNDTDVTDEQKAKIDIVYNWYNRRVIPYKLQYYNKGEVSSGLIY